ncbi:MAG: hypothetical protein ACRD1L_00885 [Terriglobales bacterium]
MNPDFASLLHALYDADVRFLVVGAYALAWYGHPRATRDLDIWIEPSPENAARLIAALRAFGAPLDGIHPGTFPQPGVALQIGVAPVRIDILTVLDGLTFAVAWDHRAAGELDGLRLDFLAPDDFVRNKRAVGRKTWPTLSVSGADNGLLHGS